MGINFQFRAAQKSDVPALLDLMVMSSWGGIVDAWERVRSEDETWQQRGLAELSDTTCEIGYNRFVVAESEAGIAGMVLLNIVGDTTRMDPRIEPIEQMAAVALIKAADYSLFIREFAVSDWARGQGVAKAFLELVDRLAITNKLHRVTLIVNDTNLAAQRLYEKIGFIERERRPSIAHPHFPDSSFLVLMDKRV